MKNPLNSLLKSLAVALAVTLTVNGCDEVVETDLIATIEFAISTQYVPEDGEATIVLELDRPAPNDESIRITIESNAILNEHFTTNLPFLDSSLVLNIEKGQKSSEFKVTSIDNATFDNGRFMIFKLTNPSQGLQLGKLTTNTLLIADDEGPSLVSFSVTSGTVSESATSGIAVEITLFPPAKEEGSVTLILDGTAVYGTDFMTQPEATNDSIVFSIKKNQTSASLNVLPMDNEVMSGHVTVVFSISAVSGGVFKGKDLKYSVIITDDEVPSTVRFETTELVTPGCDYYGYDCDPAYPIGRGSVLENNDSGMVVPILFSQPASGLGTITISWDDNSYGTRFTTIPAPSTPNTLVIPVAEGEVSSSFTVLPIDDDLFTEPPELLFEITAVSGVIRTGECLKYFLRITEDEVPSIANFPLTAGIIGEDDAGGFVVSIPFSEPTHGPGSITVNSDGGYGIHFTTDPVPTEGSDIIWNVVQNTTGVSFKIIPIDNLTCAGGNFHAGFSISSTGFIKTGNRSNYQVTITDNEVSVVSFDVNEGTVNEGNTSGKVVTLNFSKPLSENSTLHFGLGECSSRFITSPPTNCFEDYYGEQYTLLELTVEKGAVSAQITITPVNDNIQGDYVVNISPWDNGNNCLQITPNSHYQLTIVDDD